MSKKVLFVCHRFPYPPNRGGKIRPFHIISHLQKSGYSVTVASISRSPEETRRGEGLSEHCDHIVRDEVSELTQKIRMVSRVPTFTPSSMGYFYSSRLAGNIKRLLEEQKFSLIFVHCSSVAQYVRHVKGIPKVLDFGDMDSQKWLDYSRFQPFPKSLGYWLEGTKMERAERLLAREFDLCTATTRAEYETLSLLNPKGDNGWFPNGVNTEVFQPEGGASEQEPNSLVFVGRMDYYPNQECMFDFCRNTLPRIRARVPDLRLSIVGAEPPESVRALGKLPGVTVTGSVPDVRPYLKRATVALAPLNIARGTQNKILECMAMALPVVSSHLAAGGVDATEGDHLYAATTPDQYVEAIVKLLTDETERKRLGLAGRERVISNHNWLSSMSKLDTLLARLPMRPQ